MFIALEESFKLLISDLRANCVSCSSDLLRAICDKSVQLLTPCDLLQTPDLQSLWQR